MYKYTYTHLLSYTVFSGEFQMSDNPLISAYKKPALYVSLPSQGKYYKEKPKMSVDGELAVYPMTARDEIITKTPDALFNGEATVALLKSCCPDISDPRSVPVNDLKVLMTAIRIASYGNSLDMDIKCPECEHINLSGLDLNDVLARVSKNETNNVLKLGDDFTIELKPYTLEDRTILQIQQIKQQKMVSHLVQSEMDDEQRNKLFGETFIELAELTVRLIKNCIVKVSTKDNVTVEDTEQILEWLETISKDDYEMIRQRVEELSVDPLSSKFKARCDSCGHTWDSDVELDIANFFVG